MQSERDSDNTWRALKRQALKRRSGCQHSRSCYRQKIRGNTSILIDIESPGRRAKQPRPKTGLPDAFPTPSPITADAAARARAEHLSVRGANCRRIKAPPFFLASVQRALSDIEYHKVTEVCIFMKELSAHGAERSAVFSVRGGAPARRAAVRTFRRPGFSAARKVRRKKSMRRRAFFSRPRKFGRVPPASGGRRFARFFRRRPPRSRRSCAEIPSFIHSVTSFIGLF